MSSLRKRIRRLLPVAGLFGLAALATPVVLGGLGLVTWGETVLALAVLALGGLVCALGAAVWLLRRTVLELSTSVRTQTRQVTELFGQDRLELARSLDGVRTEVRELRDTALPRAVQTLDRSGARRGRHDYEQHVAWTELRAHLDVAPFMPPLRGWAASPDVLRVLVRIIDRDRPELVVECGSGASSVWIGYALRKAGVGRLVAIEHDARYAELSRALVAAHALDDVVEVRHAPLVPVPAEIADGVSANVPWYDTDALSDLKGIGLVFVDGPPQATGPEARHPAVPALLPACVERAVFVLDDADRTDERSLGDRWLAAHPELVRTEEPTEKGAHVFTRNP
ncbi:class I SAM-dependent methyltransferase [Nocardiopsis sp. MG754419]|uniref:class I SAM-dependent methyltransferase n=1 Tax=Nocardiopsis sp. MG754419 TaxID=2259865 RepID=UPI001BAD3EEA|nr:class I SAM-dependent methyltransferase [Nocardiopsis sp. MG754419]MBR8740681.1 class I SAM-dependent methyltransferase [Nocardiopsis sp. MG754419]